MLRRGVCRSRAASRPCDEVSESESAAYLGAAQRSQLRRTATPACSGSTCRAAGGSVIGRPCSDRCCQRACRAVPSASTATQDEATASVPAAFMPCGKRIVLRPACRRRCGDRRTHDNESAIPRGPRPAICGRLAYRPRQRPSVAFGCLLRGTSAIDDAIFIHIVRAACATLCAAGGQGSCMQNHSGRRDAPGGPLHVRGWLAAQGVDAHDVVRAAMIVFDSL